MYYAAIHFGLGGFGLVLLSLSGILHIGRLGVGQGKLRLFGPGLLAQGHYWGGVGAKSRLQAAV